MVAGALREFYLSVVVDIVYFVKPSIYGQLDTQLTTRGGHRWVLELQELG